MGFPRKRKEWGKAEDSYTPTVAIELMTSADNSMENEYRFPFNYSTTDMILCCAAACNTFVVYEKIK